MRLLIPSLAGLVAFISFTACGGSDGADVMGEGQDAGGSGDAMIVGDPNGDGVCKARQQTIAAPSAKHVAIGTEVQYLTNPPCGGDHYPIWAAFQEYDTPVDHRYLVHSMEHGAVVLFYKCGSRAECASTADELRAIRDALPDDPVCTDFGTKVRIIIVPDPSLDRAIGAASWGWSYTADCIDAPNLRAFIDAHYNHGRERLCNPGQSSF